MSYAALQPEETTIQEPLTNAITLRDVGLSYGRAAKQLHILRDINLAIEEKAFVCVLGPSGCGKTSLLRLLAGYTPPTTGEVHVFGKRMTAPSPEVGVVFQQANLFPWLTVRGNAEFGLKMTGVSKTERKQRVDHILEIVGLSSYVDLLPHQLSGGMKQRAALARTLVTEPKLILMDEPFAALDAITRETLQAQLKEIWASTGTTIFFITHDVDEALLLSTRIIVMNGSAGSGGIREDLESPLHSHNRSLSSVRQHSKYAALRESLVDSLKS